MAHPTAGGLAARFAAAWRPPQSNPPATGPVPHNAHIHLPPNFSAFASPAQAADLAAREGLRLLGVSNYYDFHVYAGFADLCLARGVYPVFGLEILAFDRDLGDRGLRTNDPKNPGKIYLCGKGIHRFEAPPPRAQEILAKMRANDEARARASIDKLNAFLSARGLGVRLDLDAIKAGLAGSLGIPVTWVFLQERHLAQALYDAFPAGPGGASALASLVPGYAPAWDAAKAQNEIRNALLKVGKPGYVDEAYVTVREALDLIEALGGVAAYPVLGEGANPATEFEADRAAWYARLGDWGIRALEWIPTRNTPEYLEAAVSAAAAAGLSVTVGTEHNTPVMEAMLPSCLGGKPIPEPLRPLFTEGLLYLAGYQSSAFAGRPAPSRAAAVSEGRAWVESLAAGREGGR